MPNLLKSVGQLALVLCLSTTLLTGCSTVGVRVEAPTEPFRLEAPLSERGQLMIHVPEATFTPGPFYIWYDPSKYKEALETALSQTLTASNAVRAVIGKGQPESSSTYIRVTSSFDGRVPAYKWVGRIALGVVSAPLLFIPMIFFYSETNEASFAADVIVVDAAGKEYGPVKVHTKIEFDLASRKVGEDTWPSIMVLGLEDLSRKIVLELKRHPHWLKQ